MIDYNETDVRIEPQAVREQLATILASEAFVRSRRMQRFLEFIVEETLEGRTDQIGEYSIGLAVFDRGADFEPALDPIVRNDARRLRLKLSEYYGVSHSGMADQVLIEIPKGGYVPVFTPVRSSKSRRLAVLPFEVLSTAPESAMCGRALCLSLTASLTNLDGLAVVAAASNPREQSAHDGALLNLSHAVQGSVLNAGDRGRVIINLIDVPQRMQLWAREYDFAGGDTLSLQSIIAADVRREARVRLGLGNVQPIRMAMAA